jgi:hypothetical protein
MRLDITKIDPNPFRDFEIDPIDRLQVERLKSSIEQLGFFSGVTARKMPGGRFQMAAGHHRMVAAEEEGLTYIEAVVGDYDDNAMRKIMAIENLTQRGANTGATMDAVAAFAYQVAYEVLTDRATSTNIEVEPSQKAQVRGRLASDGPGEMLIYQSINGYRRDEAVARKAEDPKAEMISMASVKNAVKSLKDSGKMARIVAKAFALVEQERAEDAAEEAEAERLAEEARKRAEAKAAADLERKRKEEEEAKRRDEQKRKDAEQAKIDAANADKARKAEADRKAKEADREALAAEKDRKVKEIARKKAEQQEADRRKLDAERRKQKEKDDNAKAAREEREREKIKAQQERDPTYDSRCDNLFEPEYARAFREAVTTPGGREVIKVKEQHALALKIIEAMKSHKRVSAHKPGTGFIDEYISDVVSEARGDKLLNIKDTEAYKVHTQKQLVESFWNEIQRSISSVEGTMKKLVDQHGKWDKKHGDFPGHVGLTSFLGVTARIEKMAILMYPNDPGVRRWQKANPEEAKKLLSNN